MTNITKINDYSVSGTFDMETSIKPDQDSSESKQLTIKVNFDQVPLKSIITKSLRPTIIVWQNNCGRKMFNKWKNHGVVEIDFVSPSKVVESREEKIEKLSMGFKLAGVDEVQALELATKAIDNPVILNS